LKLMIMKFPWINNDHNICHTLKFIRRVDGVRFPIILEGGPLIPLSFQRLRVQAIA
jgi:hypothetical protein